MIQLHEYLRMILRRLIFYSRPDSSVVFLALSSLVVARTGKHISHCREYSFLENLQ